MKTALRFAALLLTAAGTACQQQRLPTETSGPPGSRSEYCNMDAWKCDIIRAGIQHDIDHANENCRAAGYAALARFEAPLETGWGYEEGYSAEGNDMWVSMHYAPGQTPSNGAPDDGKVWVDTRWLAGGQNDPTTAGGLVAHEEQHQNGYDWQHAPLPGETVSEANKMQQACINSQP